MGLAEIQIEVARGNYYLSRHARKQLSERGITLGKVEEAIAVGEVIEDYPEDKYRPSCLILGYSARRRPLHIQCSEPMPDVIIITCYEPDPSQWVDLRVRRREGG